MMDRHSAPMNFVPLPRAFYVPSASEVAPALLGHWLVRRTPQGLAGGPIVETEAYLAKDDPACHSAKGRTERNRSMWGPPGHAYVYFIYGVHHCFNAVCQPEGIAEAVLVRAIEAELGEDFMRERRGVTRRRELTNGPGKLCAALDISRPLDGVDLCSDGSPVFIAENPGLEAFRRERGPVRITPRIGISQAAELPLRFLLAEPNRASGKISSCNRWRVF
jgi:DNA-3-methyladenine glycosylase